VESEPVIHEESTAEQPAEDSAPPDVLSNPLLQAFILDLEDVEMTPMLHLVANMMSNMYFDEAEAAVVRHYLMHKVDSTINSIQNRMDQLNADISNDQQSQDLSFLEVEEENNSDEADDGTQTTTGQFEFTLT
jgi:acyl-homoserine lactone acylase PvdQ